MMFISCRAEQKHETIKLISEVYPNFEVKHINNFKYGFTKYIEIVFDECKERETFKLTKQEVSELDNEIALKCHAKAKKILSEPNATKEQLDYVFELINTYEKYITYERPTK